MMASEMAQPEKAITVRDVGVSYRLKSGLFKRRRFWALKDVSFDLYKGEALGVIGKNGVGKSTLLRLLSGAMSPDKGTIENHGVSTSLLSLNLGFVSYLSGRENAILAGMFQGMTKAEVISRLDAIIAFAELEEFIDQPVYTYSSGMMARLGFAVAFQVQPDVLLIDEVIGVGDEDFKQKSMAVMRERIKAQDTTIVFVSHNANIVKELCSRVVWIEDRVIQAEGKTNEVLALYAHYIATKEKPRDD
jgi:lipopolysaccharide transport system ATP-binding protein